jgi:class 3 adenylate cyclase
VTQQLPVKSVDFIPPVLSQLQVRKPGIDLFLERFCPQDQISILRAVFDRQPRRLVRLEHGRELCRLGDVAYDFWIIESGEISVCKDSHRLNRRAGELVGEAWQYRIDGEGQLTQRRGATLSAYGDACVFRLDRAFLACMSDAERAAWHETMGRVLTAKLDEATDQRDMLRRARWSTETLVDRFVSADGREAACAAFQADGFTRQIDAESCNAVVWFSDVAGFSAHALTLSPDQAGQVIRRIMDIQSAAIQSAGGQIDKFMGDGLMAYWRAPDEERLAAAASRAVAAAVACTRELEEHFRADGLHCDIRIGLHCGPVILGDFGGGDRVAFTLIGETVNSASRYEQAKTCIEGKSLGRVRVSPSVFRFVSDPDLRAAFEGVPRTFADKHATRFEAYAIRREGDR